MDLRRLEVFCKLMQTRSFSKTGHELELTQPTVSGHIKTLEQQIGLQLFDRHRRLVRPTSAAMVLYDYAQRILDLTNEAGFALERFRGRISGDLKLGGSTIPGTYILPGIVGRFHRVYPDTRIRLALGDTNQICDQVANGDIEIGVVGAAGSRPELTYESFIEDEMVLIVPPGHPWAEIGRIVKIKELSTSPFVIREEGSGTRTTALKALAQKNLPFEELNIVAEMGSTEAVRQAVKADLGVSIISWVAAADDIKSGLLALAKVRGLDLRRQFYLVTNPKRTRSPVCGAFLEYLTSEGRPKAALTKEEK
jgi:DNA-binding transcriptional LysR family regulator